MENNPQHQDPLLQRSAGLSGGPPQNSDDALLVLILGIGSLLMFWPLGPVAWYLGNKELERIARGESSPLGRDKAQVGKVLGIISTLLTGLSVLAAIAGVFWFLVIASVL